MSALLDAKIEEREEFNAEQAKCAMETSEEVRQKEDLIKEVQDWQAKMAEQRIHYE